MKFCKDCKHFVPCEEFDQSDFNYFSCGKCARPLHEFDPVSGRKVLLMAYADFERERENFSAVLYGECGKSGRYFEPKEHPE